MIPPLKNLPQSAPSKTPPQLPGMTPCAVC